MFDLSSIYLLPLLSIFNFLLIASVTPGPNNSMLASSVAIFSWQRTVPHALGIIIAAPFGFFFVAVSLGTVHMILPNIEIYMKIIGFVIISQFSLKMFYNAYIEHKKKDQEEAKNLQSHHATADEPTHHLAIRPMTFVGAASFQFVNPKLWLIAIGVNSTYLQSDVNVFLQALIMYLLAFLSSIPAVIMWMFIGKIIGEVMHKKIVMLNVLMGFLMLLTIAFLYI